MERTLPSTRKAILNNGNNSNDSIAKLTITHPFHPFNGQTFEYISQRGKSVRCLDDKGNAYIIPIKYTSMYTSIIGEFSTNGGIVAPIEELVALKELVDDLFAHHETLIEL